VGKGKSSSHRKATVGVGGRTTAAAAAAATTGKQIMRTKTRTIMDCFNPNSKS
jgi:hypothetical protein